jgi:MraZ protein
LGERCILTRGFGGCLALFSEEQWRLIEARLDEGPQFNRRKMRFQRFMFSLATEVKPDSQGRIAIPQELREWAKIEPNAEVRVSGNMNWVEIWNRKNYYDMISFDKENEDELLSIAEEYMV